MSTGFGEACGEGCGVGADEAAGPGAEWVGRQASVTRGADFRRDLRFFRVGFRAAGGRFARFFRAGSETVGVGMGVVLDVTGC